MRWISLTLVALVFGCSSITEPERVQVLGAIAGFNQDDPQIEIIPENGTVTVRVTTYGNGCYSEGETETVVEGMEATITPWDYTVGPGSDVVCTAILLSFTHEAVLQFDGTGTARILVRGIDAAHASKSSRGEEIVVERTVDVS